MERTWDLPDAETLQELGKIVYDGVVRARRATKCTGARYGYKTRFPLEGDTVYLDIRIR